MRVDRVCGRCRRWPGPRRRCQPLCACGLCAVNVVWCSWKAGTTGAADRQGNALGTTRLQQKDPAKILISTNLREYKITMLVYHSKVLLPPSLVCNGQHVHETWLKNRFGQDTRISVSARVRKRGQFSLIYPCLKVLLLVPDKCIPCAISVPR